MIRLPENVRQRKYGYRRKDRNVEISIDEFDQRNLRK